MNFKKWLEVFDAPPEAPGGVVWHDDATDEVLPGPTCGRDLVARLGLAGQSYWVRIEEGNPGDYDLSFGTKERGVFLTKGNSPFTVLSTVFGVFRTFLNACPQARFNYTAYSTSRGVVFERLFEKLFPDYAQDEDGYYSRQR